MGNPPISHRWFSIRVFISGSNFKGSVSSIGSNSVSRSKRNADQDLHNKVHPLFIIVVNPDPKLFAGSGICRYVIINSGSDELQFLVTGY